MKRKPIIIGIILTVLFLLIGIATLGDYGLTWDFHFHFFSGAHFFGLKPIDVEPRTLPYVEPDPRNTARLPYGPFVQIVPFASWLLFYKYLNVLPYDVAYNLPIVIAGVLGITVLYFFLSEAINWRVGLIAAIFLMLTPRYFADIHNDMKDAPLAAVFAFNIWMLWRLATYRRFKDLVFASIAFALAFNTKINSIFIPVIFAAWCMVLNIKKTKFELLYFLVAPTAAFLLWWFFWGDPIGQLKLAVSTFGGGADNIEVLLGGQWFCAGSTVPWYYPFWYLAITTPLPILFFFFIGLISLIRRIRPISLLLLLWFFLPLTRYLLPKIAVIDGVRHFEEVLYPIAAIAAVGAVNLSRKIKNIKVIALITIIIFLILLKNIIVYHPFQIAYYNELVGGVRGAFGNYDLDYWASSQKQAVNWLNTHAERNASVTIMMAGNVSGLYLRPDLFDTFNRLPYNKSDYTIILNRQSFFYRYYYVFGYLLTHTPIHTITVEGAPLVWIFDNRTPNVSHLAPWWKGEDPCIRKYW